MSLSSGYDPVFVANDKVLEEMAQLLLKNPQLDDALRCLVQIDQGSETLEQAVTQWIRSLLATSEHELCQRLMPLIATQFGNYLREMEKHSKWVH